MVRITSLCLITLLLSFSAVAYSQQQPGLRPLTADMLYVSSEEIQRGSQTDPTNVYQTMELVQDCENTNDIAIETECKLEGAAIASGFRLTDVYHGHLYGGRCKWARPFIAPLPHNSNFGISVMCIDTTP